MAVYVDKLRNWGWRLGPSSHLISDATPGDNAELHAFAEKIGLKREWFQRSSSVPHYDLTAGRRATAVKAGAIELDDRQFYAILKRWREDAKARILTAASEEERAAIRAELYR